MKTKYVIKGSVKHVFPDENIAYFVGMDKQVLWGDGIWDVRNVSAVIEGATFYDSYQDALDVIRENELHGFDAFPVCPICRKDYEKKPAISRKDNKTEICPNCGVLEALNDWRNSHE